MQNMEWLKELKPKALQFLEQMKGKTPGFFRYSLTGDIYSEDNPHWGLGNAVFAVKIYYMLDESGKIDKNERDEYIAFIKSFQNKKGEIHDKLIQRNSLSLRIKDAVLHGETGNIRNRFTRQAETRQAVAALMCLGDKPDTPYKEGIPETAPAIENYIKRLNWNMPWGAGSHFSHLLFFLKANGAEEKLIDHAVRVLESYNSKKDGSWYRGGNGIPAHQKINGAMKVITGLEAAAKTNVINPKQLTDLCLSGLNDRHACNNLDIVYVLYHCSRLSDHRSEEIKAFCRERIDDFKRFYWPQYGGFSFFAGKANDVYYSARITRGLREPDIHGTVLFLWGIALISGMLGMDKELGFKLPIT